MSGAMGNDVMWVLALFLLTIVVCHVFCEWYERRDLQRKIDAIDDLIEREWFKRYAK